MQTQHDIRSHFNHLTAFLDERSYAIDPAFDDGVEELEREFAELRLQLNHYE